MQTDVLFHVLDEETKKHCLRTQEMSKDIARKIDLDDVFVMQITIAARYHDVGKVLIPKHIIAKPSSLTEKEYELIKEHARNGFRITSEIFHRDICEMILYHHENEDGSGYYGMDSFHIPLGAQIIHVCDVYDALTSKRPYHEPMEEKEALQYLKDNAGTLFNPDIVNAFLELKENKEN